MFSGDRTSIGVGGGIVALSDPEMEFHRNTAESKGIDPCYDDRNV